MMKALLVVLFIVAVALVVADLALRSFAEERMADAVEAALEIPADAEVSVDAFPFVVNTLQGRYPGVTVEAEDVGEGSVDLSRLQLEFTDVEFSLSNLLSGDERRVRLGAGEGEALVRERDLNQALRREGVSARIDFHPGGRVEVLSADGSVAGVAEVTLDGPNLVVTPEGGLGIPSFSLELPLFGTDMSYDSVDVRGSTARLGVSVGETVAEF
jgi:hypothetical protein